MGARKHNKAELIKEEKKNKYFASLNDCPTSPKKMRIIADLIRGMDVEKALHLLKVTPNDSAARLRKLVLSAIANWQQKNETARVEDANLYIKTIFVNEGRSLKRMRFNSQGRGNRIQKRSNHVTVEIDSRVNNTNIES